MGKRVFQSVSQPLCPSVAMPTQPDASSISTADLYDTHRDDVQVATPRLHHYGGVTSFGGEVATVHVHEDNVLMRELLATPGEGRVLVVDGGGSTWCALLGDRMAQRAIDNGWRGVVLNACIRDSAEVATMPVGVMALGTSPRKSRKEGVGAKGVPVTVAGCLIEPGNFLYADEDGLLVADEDLLA
jgi:regulator of ribonuclease activity A